MVFQKHHKQHICVQITDCIGGEIYFTDKLENENGKIKVEDVKPITLAFTMTGKQMKKKIFNLKPRNKRKSLMSVVQTPPPIIKKVKQSTDMSTSQSFFITPSQIPQKFIQNDTTDG